jgi:2-oxoglutarate dehydrogenase E1 component
MTVAIPTTPANHFHLLRWQALGPHHRPLIVFTPKSLLRHRAAVSAPGEFTSGHFQPVMTDTTVDPAAVTRVLFCTGKVFYDLSAQREQHGSAQDTAIVRVEQLYPLPVEEIKTTLAAFPNATEYRWVQVEPANQGAWPFMALHFAEQVGQVLYRVSRPASSAPAVGSHSVHEYEQQQLIEQAFSR